MESRQAADKPAKTGVLNWSLLKGRLRYLLTGGMALKDGHLPVADHMVSPDFAGVCVATAEDVAIDRYVVDRLEDLGIQQVRVDITYGDLENHVARLIDTLISRKNRILLHLVQPYAAARKMEWRGTEQRAWREFVGQVLDRFGADIVAVEVGSTINRKRWAGYGAEGFFAAWTIAYEETRRRSIKLAGPNITDFEPIYNLAVLSQLRKLGMLPDIHTNNLFSERVTEPERFDHRILGFRWATRFKVNLVKKARLLKKITTDLGMTDLMSPAAFWTLPRIRRLLPDCEQKQADYLARYMLLCAASGALRQAFWGPLICQREGLIDDGTSDYPEMERITHYRSVSGEVGTFRLRPSFLAMRTFARLIPGSRYDRALSTANGLEVHVFRSDQHTLHAIWTGNGRAAVMSDLYAQTDLSHAVAISRDGEMSEKLPEMVTEAPVYLCWPTDTVVNLRTESPQFVSIHRHMVGKQHCVIDSQPWFGLFVAVDAQEAEAIRPQWAPDRLRINQETLLRKARNAIWTIPDPRDLTGRLVVKKPLKVHWHKRFLDRNKPSKARRSWEAAAELLRRGIDTAMPVAFVERSGDITLIENYYICEFVEADATVREMVSAFASGEREFLGVAAPEAYRQLCRFLLGMHGKGVYFRDLSGGNILIRKRENGEFRFTLIDINRARFFNHSTVLGQRIADLTRVCNKLHWAGREQLVGMYLHALGLKFTWRLRLPFYLYDIKVDLKRRIGRKAIRRLLGRPR